MGEALITRRGGGGSNIVNGIIQEYYAESEDIKPNTFIETCNNQISSVQSEKAVKNSMIVRKLSDNKYLISSGDSDYTYYTIANVNPDTAEVTLGTTLSAYVSGSSSPDKYSTGNYTLDIISPTKAIHNNAYILNISGNEITMESTAITRPTVNNGNYDYTLKFNASFPVGDGTFIGSVYGIVKADNVSLAHYKYVNNTLSVISYKKDLYGYTSTVDYQTIFHIKDNVYGITFYAGITKLILLRIESNTIVAGADFTLDPTSYVSCGAKVFYCDNNTLYAAAMRSSTSFALTVKKISINTETLSSSLVNTLNTTYGYRGDNGQDNIIAYAKGELVYIFGISSTTETSCTSVGVLNLSTFTMTLADWVCMQMKHRSSEIAALSYDMIVFFGGSISYKSEYICYESWRLRNVVKKSVDTIRGLTKSLCTKTTKGKVWLLNK